MDVHADLRPYDTHIAFAELRRLWQRCRGSAAIPPKSAFSAELLRPWLPYILVLEVVNHRYRCRLAGTAVVRAIGREITGCYLDELVVPLFYPCLIERYLQAAHLGVPVEDELHSDPLIPSELGRTIRRLILPCTKDTGQVDAFVVCIMAHKTDDASGRGSQSWTR